MTIIVAGHHERPEETGMDQPQWEKPEIVELDVAEDAAGLCNPGNSLFPRACASGDHNLVSCTQGIAGEPS